ncbi:hypothetical protein L484_010921 [Morus notabilis]|uniref:Bifunctional inhibitor/plant lipid transfer protein/seed storage helical domain-containing protein n=2 Tax=Morus notabilis TaxID=981085 RepID=W9RJ74_9ROSA|nr:hypothetical protein L484_010921 [Morus notabilis]
MKHSKTMNALVLVFMLVTMTAMMGVEAQGQLGQPGLPVPAPTCTSTFFSALIRLIPCRAAVAPFSPIPPSEACCNSVKALGQPCLCILINGPPISGVDRNMALQLPEKCTANFEPCSPPVYPINH